MIKVYGIPNCGTVKKALNWFQENKVEYAFHDFKKLGVSKEKLKEWSRVFGWENLLNKSGTTWRSLSEEQQGEVKSEASAIALMQAYTSVIKRPVVEANSKYLLRFDEQQFRETLLKS
jgi:Spx/MgsR family transcriptional regulator